MSTKEIKELRQAGKLEDAYKLAKEELLEAPDNIWAKRNISWVYYEYLKLNSSPEHFDPFIACLHKIISLQLTVEENMFFEKLSWQIGKMIFNLLKDNHNDSIRSIKLFENIKPLSLIRPSEGYSFLFKAFHKALKETSVYLQFADWWDFNNFMPEDFQKEKLPNGKEVMSIAEQGYIAYAKHLLPTQIQSGEIIFDKEKVVAFLPVISNIAENHPRLQYPAYFHAKLLLALGDKDNMLDALLPFAKKRRNDFWVWEIMAEAFSNDNEKVFACYCKALSCNSPEEMLVSLRQKMASIFISKGLYNEAKTEIGLLVTARQNHDFRIPAEVVNWQSQEWFNNANAKKSNFWFYKEYITIAESLLFSDIPEETVFVKFVNSDKKILNFSSQVSKQGFFKYERFLTDVKVGDILNVRFESKSSDGRCLVFTAVKSNNEFQKNQKHLLLKK